MSRADGDQGVLLLVEMESVAGDSRLPYLLSFDAVEGLSVEQHVAIVERAGQDSLARLGQEGKLHVSLAPLQQFKRIAASISQRPGCSVTAALIERALAFCFLARLTGATAVVSSAGPAFGPGDYELLSGVRVLNVREALALIGAHVRQRDVVPLGGDPPLVQERTEVYPLTARSIIPVGQDWWASCVHNAGRYPDDWLGYAEAVFKRIGQALRGRDGVHEALRTGLGRSAILDALYHLDVVLMSSVGALDALARVADRAFGVSANAQEIAWQRTNWRKSLAKLAPAVAAVVEPAMPLGAALLLLTRTRNSIHGIPLDEFLSLEQGTGRCRAEHRVMISSELVQNLRATSGSLGPLNAYGLHADAAGMPFLNVGEFTEHLLNWAIRIVGELLRAMLTFGQFSGGVVLQRDEFFELQAEFCAALAQVGNYPYLPGPKGLPARPSVHQSVMTIAHKNRASR